MHCKRPALEWWIAARVFCLAAAGILFLTLAVLAVWTFRDVSRLSKRLESRLAERDAQVSELIDRATRLTRNADESISDNYLDTKATMNTVAVAARDTEELIHDLRATLVGGKDSRGSAHSGLIPEATLLLADSRSAIDSMRSDLNTLTASADETLKPLSVALDNLASLTASIETQVNEGGPIARETIEQLNTDLAELERMIADPNIAKAIAHTANSLESVDIALQPWRKKAHLLKVVLGKVLSLFRVVKTF